MNDNKNKNYYFLVVLLVIFLVTPIFGSIFELIIGRKMSSGFYGPSNPEYVPGFLLSYMFFVSMYLLYVGNLRKKTFILLSCVFIIFMDLFFGAFQELIITIFFSLLGGFIGWALKGVIIVFRNKKIKK